MSLYPADNITGPDPREDDTALSEREVVVTVTIRTKEQVSNRNCEAVVERMRSDIDALLSLAGFRDSDIQVEVF